MKLLHIDASILGGNSASRKISAAIVERLKSAHPGLEVAYRDLAAQPLAHLSPAHLAARQGLPAPLAETENDLARSRRAGRVPRGRYRRDRCAHV